MYRMETTTIILIVVILILIYLLYAFFSDSSIKIVTEANLNESQNPIEIDKPTNTRYSFGCWLFVNSWNTGVRKTIYKREYTPVSGSITKNIELYLDETSPTMKLLVETNNGNEDVVITTNFPIQKWSCIIVSVDNDIIDIYIDGKLLKSHKVNDIKRNLPDKSSKLQLGGPGIDMYVRELKRWTQPIDPTEAWDYYSEGNGKESTMSSLASYGIDVSVLKGNIEQTKFSLK